MTDSESGSDPFAKTSRTVRTPPADLDMIMQDFHTPVEGPSANWSKRPRESPDDPYQSAKRPSPWIETTLLIGGDIRETLSGMRKWNENQHKTRKFTHDYQTTFERFMSQIEYNLRKLELAFTTEIGRLDQTSGISDMVKNIVNEIVEPLKNKLGNIQSDSKTVPSYANTVKVSANLPIKTTIPSPKPSVLIYPSESSLDKSSDNTKKTVLSAIKPAEMGWKIAGVRRVRNGGIILQTTDQVMADGIKNHADLIKTGVKIQEPVKIRPRVLVYGVPANLSNSELIHAIQKQNFEHINLEDMKKQVKPITRSANRNGDYNWIIECEPNMRQKFIEKDKLYLEWSCCRVRDYINMPRCYNCQTYNHVSKYCTAKQICSLCAVEGHSHKNCPTPNNLKCINCFRFKQPSDHSAVSKECPVYLKSLEAAMKKICYG